jgi:hypothetical protein
VLNLTREQLDLLRKEIPKFHKSMDIANARAIERLEVRAVAKLGIQEYVLDMSDVDASRFKIRGGGDKFMVFQKEFWSVVQSILKEVTNPETDLVWEYTPRFNAAGQRCFKEVYEAKWMETMQGLVGPGKPILAIIVASDETNITLRGRNEHPVYISLGNIRVDLRTDARFKRLLAFLPGLYAVGKKNANHPKTRLARRLAHNRAIARVLEEVVSKQESGVELDMPDGSKKRVWPRVAFAVADHPEIQKYSFMYSGWRAKCPCRFCMFDGKNALQTTVDAVRCASYIRAFVESAPSAEELRCASLYREANRLWDIPGWNVYTNPMCRMHVTDHGIVAKLVTQCVKWCIKRKVVSEI